MAKQKSASTKFKVGDWVTYPFAPERIHVRIIEVRGPLGVGGEEIYRVRHIWEWGEVREFEARESILQASSPPAHQPVAKPEEEWARWTG